MCHIAVGVECLNFHCALICRHTQNFIVAIYYILSLQFAACHRRIVCVFVYVSAKDNIYARLIQNGNKFRYGVAATVPLFVRGFNTQWHMRKRYLYRRRARFAPQHFF